METTGCCGGEPLIEQARADIEGRGGVEGGMGGGEGGGGLWGGRECALRASVEMGKFGFQSVARRKAVAEAAGQRARVTHEAHAVGASCCC